MENVIWLGVKAWERWKLWMVTVSFLLFFFFSSFLLSLLFSFLFFFSPDSARIVECVCILEYECPNLHGDVHGPSLVRPFPANTSGTKQSRYRIGACRELGNCGIGELGAGAGWLAVGSRARHGEGASAASMCVPGAAVQPGCSLAGLIRCRPSTASGA